MYYRRKVLMALIEAFGGKLEKLRFQKLLFLVARNQKNPCFEFVPYSFGAFSFQSYADIGTLTKYEQAMQDDNFVYKTDKENYFTQLLPEDRLVITEVVKRFGSYSSNELINYTYANYPWYATKSTIIKKAGLTPEQVQKIENQKRISDDMLLMTIGYEGIGLEKYLNKLLINSVDTLVDVRKNPISMKYGFSKKTLQNACQRLDINYVHLPQYGIDSQLREGLSDQATYDRLFEQYELRIEDQVSILDELYELVKKRKRIALTCFEHDVCQCHRGTLARLLIKHSKFTLNLKHIS